MPNSNLDTAKNPRPFYLLAAAALAATLLSPCIAGAVSIGEIVMQSKLGEPLLARVELTTASGENIETSCLSLAASDPHDAAARNFLLKTRLEIKTEGAKRYVVISSHKTFNELFARLQLQVKCPGMASIIKTLTLLPDLDTLPPAAIVAPATGTSATAQQDPVSNAPADIPDAARNTRPENAAQQILRNDNAATPSFGTSESSPKVAPPAKQRHAHTTRKNQQRQVMFRLKLSGNPIDESRIGKISPEERELLLARQKLFDADDQMASFLALQYQVKQLQNELGEVKLKLARLDSLPPAAISASPIAATPESAHAPVAASAETKSATIKKPPVTVQQDNPLLQRGLLAVVSVLVTAALFMLLRRHMQIKSQQAAKHVLTQTATEATPAVIPNVPPHAPPHAPPPTAPASVTPPPVRMEPQAAAIAPPKIVTTPKETAPPPAQPDKAQTEPSEEDPILEEAELYAVHGHPDRAIKLLYEIIAQNPAHTKARMLLISILSSLSKVEEFERAARDFLKYNKNSASWKIIQILGRTLDQGNPLYADESNAGINALLLAQIATNNRRPVGDILIEMGALSEQDMKNCLTDFDPKVHGRFGGYLISRKVITLSQLNDALLKQQGTGTGTKPEDMSGLQEMENFLAVPDIAPPQPESRVPGFNTPLDFVFEPSTEKEVLDFEVTQPSSAFPEIDFDLGSSNPPEKK